jgi:hypothetical protein
MAITVNIQQGFYVDPDTNRTFFVKEVNGISLIPPWVKSKSENWRKLKK